MKIRLLFLSLVACLCAGNQIAKAYAKDLVPGGENVGIEIRPDGLIISGTYDVKSGYTIYNPSRDSDIKRGDLLYEMEGNAISSLEDFSTHFQKYVDEKEEVRIRLKRKENSITRKLRIIKEDNRYRTGLYIKERLIGIGTVSFYDPDTKIYGALGHAIIDNDSGTMVEVKSGAIYTSNVKGINKSTNGNPGEKVATFSNHETLGTVLENTSIGIYGQYEDLPNNKKPVPLAKHDEVELGSAEIYTVTEGQNIMRYNIEITQLKKQDVSDIKGITFKVVDQTLLEKAGGIVAGMSGSPILQNGKLIGAVTHVLVDKVQYGYGIYMEWMWEEAERLASTSTSFTN